MNPFIDPFVAFVLALTALIAVGVPYIVKHGIKRSDDSPSGS